MKIRQETEKGEEDYEEESYGITFNRSIICIPDRMRKQDNRGSSGHVRNGGGRREQ